MPQLATDIRRMRGLAGRLLLNAGLLLSTLLLALPSSAYEITGSKWRTGGTDFYVSMTGTSASGIAWHDSFLAAIADWQRSTVFDFNVIEQDLDPCLEDGLNSVEFTADVCGTEYGASTLAVTLRRYIPTILGEADIYEADVVINNTVGYDIYDGNIYSNGHSDIDFRRVAIHELGHVMGLEHESNVAAIMAPTIGDIDRPTQDDIDGVNALYTALQSCAQKSLFYGSLNGSLSTGDCTVQQITGGGTDTSYVDIYRLDLANVATITLNMQSAALDSVLLIADLNLGVIAYDAKEAGVCSSTLSRNLSAGSYLVLANTYDVQVDEACVTEGDYQFSAHYKSSTPLSLGGAASTSAVVGRGSFTGAASTDNGLYYQTHFSSDEKILARGEIRVAEQDVGKPGFVLAAARVGEQIFALRPDGIFEEKLPNSGEFPKYRHNVLGSLEVITLLDNIVAGELGIHDLDIEFLIGYGLDSAPETVFYNEKPIKVVITPPSP